MSVVCLIEPEYLKKSSRAELNSCLERLMEMVPNMTLKRQLKAKNKGLCMIDRSLTRFWLVCLSNWNEGSVLRLRTYLVVCIPQIYC